MTPEIQAELAQSVGSQVDKVEPLRGGDINQAWRVSLTSGDVIFVKTNPSGPEGLFGAEAAGLKWLSEAQALCVPDVLAVGSVPSQGYLALRYLAPGPRVAGYDDILGRGLAKLHKHGAPSFGLDHPNFIGTLRQENQSLKDWPSFYGERRIQAQLNLAIRTRRASSKLQATLETLIERLPDLLGPPEPPARLHGDLWGGNLHTTHEGLPALIDPATYAGHREVDLAMMRLFGGFSERVFASYHEAYPLEPGHQERVGLYQLYPLLVHLNLFGGHYAESVYNTALRYL